MKFYKATSHKFVQYSAAVPKGTVDICKKKILISTTITKSRHLPWEK